MSEEIRRELLRAVTVRDASRRKRARAPERYREMNRRHKGEQRSRLLTALALALAEVAESAQKTANGKRMRVKRLRAALERAAQRAREYEAAQ